jgi:hypothetical protein
MSATWIRKYNSSGFFLKQELLPVTNYPPDIEAIKRNKVKAYMVAKERSLQKKRFYAETAQVLAERLGCEFRTSLGHHGSFVDMPDAWAAALRNVLVKIK